MPPSALATAIATTTQDYRTGEWTGMTPQHVDTWASQFDPAVRVGVLAEMDHLLKQVYISKATMSKFLNTVATDTKLTGGNPPQFWRTAGILAIQRLGSSQKQMLAEFDATLQAAVGFGLSGCAATSDKYIYLDDAIFSGGHLKNDLIAWLPKAPTTCHIHVVVLGLHTNGSWSAEKDVKAEAAKAGKTLTFTFWRCVEFNNSLRGMANSDVFHPNTLPNDANVQAYVQQLTADGRKLTLRPGNNAGKLFSSPTARALLEEQMLIKGAYLRSVCTNLTLAQRPLGYIGYYTLGFGGTLVTYRNCPNNCPLPYWLGNPWYPLFPRRTNTQSALGRNSLWT
jgi:hypothetical protein